MKGLYKQGITLFFPLKCKITQKLKSRRDEMIIKTGYNPILSRQMQNNQKLKSRRDERIIETGSFTDT